MYSNRTAYGRKSAFTLLAALIIAALLPATSWACACGCGLFDVQTGAMFPTGQGGTVFAEFDFMNQDKNWHGTSRGLAENNDDKDIKTNFYTVGAQYMFSRAWGAEVEVPYWDRHFTTDTGGGDIQHFNHSNFGDVRIKGIYSGFSPDMSTGITFGLKLPTGDYTYRNFDRDTEIGSGGTDILLGAYHMGKLTGMFNWFVNGELDQPVLITAGYRPGSELDAVGGVYYNGWSIGNVKIAPMAQVIGSYRLHDRGLESNTDDSGYERILLSPGVEVDSGAYSLFADISVPVFQRVRGDQLVAGELFKVSISRRF